MEHSLDPSSCDGQVLHIVVRTLANGVDRIKLIEPVQHADGFEAAAGPIDVSDPAIRDLVHIGLKKTGLTPEIDSSASGFSYRDEEGRRHIYIWWQPPRPSLATA